MENRLLLTGQVCRAPETRRTPAGIAVTRFTLEHRSPQQEAGMQREAWCRIVVVAAGETQGLNVASLMEGDSVKVCGFISRADSRQGQSRLVLHAQCIDAVTD